VLTLQKLGFTNAYALLGGLNAWTAAGLPTQAEPAAPAAASGSSKTR
jgi:rhodanese-related sulfurtransferase